MKTFFKLLTLLFIFSFPTSPAFPGDFQAGGEKTINHPFNEDLYVSGGTILVNAPINGDLAAAGGSVTLNDSVNGDALLGGGNLIINGNIKDDLRAAGGKMRIEQDVLGDVVVAGGEVTISSGVTIFGDLISTGGKIQLNGTVKGRAKMTGGEIYLNGKVEKNLEVKGGKLFLNGEVMGKSTLAARNIIVEDQARLHQDVAYWQESGPVNFGQAMVSGRASFRPDLQIGPAGSSWYYLGFGSVIILLIYLAAVTLLLFLFQYIFTDFLAKAGARFNDHKGRILGYGAVYFIAMPLASILLMITIIGLPVGLFGLVFYLFSVAVAYVITALVIANWYALIYRTGWNKQTTVWAALGIFLFLKLIAMLPVVGWLLAILAIGMSYGAIIESLRQRREQERILVA